MKMSNITPFAFGDNLVRSMTEAVAGRFADRPAGWWRFRGGAGMVHVSLQHGGGIAACAHSGAGQGAGLLPRMLRIRPRKPSVRYCAV